MTDVHFPSFDEHARQQRERELEKTPAERLAWLWQARLFALALEKTAKRNVGEDEPENRCDDGADE